MKRENVERNFGFLVHDIARLMRTNYDRRVKRLGLTRSQWWVITNLYRNDGLTQSELAETLDIERASLGRLLDRLEANGWVRREPCRRDRRAKRVRLTNEVVPVMREMRAIAAGLRSDAMSGLAPGEQEAFVDVLLAIKSNLLVLNGQGSAGAPTPPPTPLSALPSPPRSPKHRRKA
ncbi:MAG: MarR family transcriptional regulator [Thiotrichales bacterium]|nr:MarR family transcriptional regulator [Thiotrichales bacterium]MCY4285013.1 MarR family transcriptional regulator [Thiotrichales bacterium]MCY4351366.1 MarR family transcriptional regulator [Thiotrichales bacterium]